MPQWVITIFILLLMGLAVLSYLGGGSNTQSVSAQGVPSQAGGPGTGSQSKTLHINIGAPAPAGQNVTAQSVPQNQAAPQNQATNTQPAQATNNNAAPNTNAAPAGQPNTAGQPRTQDTPPQTDQPVIAVNSHGMPVILIRYVVQSGDSLSSIAQKYHSTINLILQQNGSNIPDQNHLAPGQTIYVPDP